MNKANHIFDEKTKVDDSPENDALVRLIRVLKDKKISPE